MVDYNHTTPSQPPPNLKPFGGGGRGFNSVPLHRQDKLFSLKRVLFHIRPLQGGRIQQLGGERLSGDVCAPRYKLIIELDGSQHLKNKAQDYERSSYLASRGYRILRFWNNEVSNNLEGVIIAIEQALIEIESIK